MEKQQEKKRRMRKAMRSSVTMKRSRNITQNSHRRLITDNKLSNDLRIIITVINLPIYSPHHHRM